MNNKVLIIGFGSIGQRHACVLDAVGCKVFVLSQHVDVCKYLTFKSLEVALEQKPDYVVIANETEKHYETLDLLTKLEYRGKIFVEKPLFHSIDLDISNFKNIVNQIYVGYVMRFHPLIQQAKEWLKSQEIYSINAYCGQYLPERRPNSDYRKSYSAKVLGGGVINDLSHELDYLQFLAGEWDSVISIGGHITNLEIEAEDMVSFLLMTKRCKNIVCQLNYWDKNTQRFCIINAEKGTCTMDFISNTLTINKNIFHYPQERNQMFAKMHKKILKKEGDLCIFEEALSVVRLIDAIKESRIKKIWIKRKR